MISNFKIYYFFVILLFSSFYSSESKAQLALNTSLEELIATAQDGSSAALLAKTRLENQFWRNVSFNSNFKPQFAINATLPSINRSISSIPLPDGSEAFVNRAFMNNSIGLQMSQIIPQTGGSVFVGTQLERLDLFGTSSQTKSTSYLSAPLSIGFNQPLFQFNRFKWDQQINELEFKRAEKLFVEEKEMIAFEVVNRYFQLYLNELTLATATNNQNYLDSLANTAVKRFELGRIGETEMLQVQLSAKNANAQVASLEQDKQNNTERLRNYLGIREEVRLNLQDPAEKETSLIDKSLALEYANKNRSRIMDFDIRIKSAMMDVEVARSTNQPDLNITGSFGLTQSSSTFGGAFSGLRDQESIRLSVRIPIADWGRSRAQREIAQSSLALEELQLKEDRIDFEREVVLAVDRLSLIRERLLLAKTALDIAQKRQDISKKRYQLGKQDATNLNIAIQEYANAERSYYQALWDMWQVHHQIRLLTLYDFQSNEVIEYETADLNISK